ncbi:MAG: COX15/CtaA family protein [Bdellovibrionales bacterium]|nr:COX15/CtaA family protein [Bdellovibrionales bacterium]
MRRNRFFPWLLACLVLVTVMISVGGVTRLTRSGLSITEWKPVTGWIPPLSEADWTREFDLYRLSPEFQQVNSHFELQDYKRIFWWEFLHRVLGRVIFFVVLFGAIRYRRDLGTRRAFGLPVLVVFQGLMGWIMVKSGLTHRPSVSHYLLAAHFFLALATLLVIYGQLVRFKKPLGVRLGRRDAALGVALGLVILVQVLWGCFTSGLKAGVYYSTYPLMGGEVLPATAFALSPWLANFLENPVAVQWVHRWMGTVTFLFTLGLSWFYVTKVSRSLLRPFLHLASVMTVQFVLGVAVLLLAVPVSLAVFHQFMAVLVVLGYFNFALRVEWPWSEG